MSYTKTVLSFDGLDKNFKLIITEVVKQVENTLKVLDKPGKKLIEKIKARDDYIDNLKRVIENSGFKSTSKSEFDKKAINIIKALVIITNNLERIADYAVNIVFQTQYLDNKDFIKRYDYKKYFKEVLHGLELTQNALFKREISMALKICKAESNLDKLFANSFKKIIIELKSGSDTEDLITSLFILRYLERMGDSLLNIGEAVILAVIGEKFKIQEFQNMEDSIESGKMQGNITDMTIESIDGTQSGCNIRRICGDRKEDSSHKEVIFKDGILEKLEMEKENIEIWGKLQSDLPPAVYGFQKSGKKASILLEYLDGSTFQQIIIDPKNTFLEEAFEALKNTVSMIWNQTRKKNDNINAGFINQLSMRIEDILKTHPHFSNSGEQICSLDIHSFEKMIEITMELEKELNAPFSVLIHGDFNIDNIIYDQNKQKIHYVDLHRSEYQDYIQDISVFLISNFRIPVFVSSIRDRLNRVIVDFLGFSRDFAQNNGDKTFELRLALGLVRSFTTSTRFEFNLVFSRNMYLRAVYLLEKIINHRGDSWDTFKLPEGILIY